MANGVLRDIENAIDGIEATFTSLTTSVQAIETAVELFDSHLVAINDRIPAGATYVRGRTVAITGTTSTALTGMEAPGAGISTYVLAWGVGNTSATVPTLTLLNDEDDVILSILHSSDLTNAEAGASDSASYIILPCPLKLTANKALEATNTVNSSSTYVWACGYTLAD